MFYVIGHKSPDLDSVAAAISYAELKNKLDNTNDYKPAAAGNINKETRFALEKFNFSAPEILENASGKNLILVDHNEASQITEGSTEAIITEVLDHHKINFSYSEPIYFVTKPWGASSTIIADLYFNYKIELSKDMAGLLLSAILVDTVITKSPTSTEKDKEMIIELARIAQIEDWQEFGMELFKIRASIKELSAAEVINSDFKDFDFKAGKFGIGQVETADLKDFSGREQEILNALNEIKKNNYHTVMLIITDIINGNSIALAATDDENNFNKAFNTELNNGQAQLPGVISRKKQIVPALSECFDK